MNKLFICFNVFLLLLIFLAGGIKKIFNFQETVNSLKTQINTIQLNPIFIASVILIIMYFYVILNIQIYGKNQNLYSFLLMTISITLIGIPFLVFFKNYLNKAYTIIYNIAICGVIGLLTLGSLLVLYSLYTGMYQNYAYVATIGLATFIAMTILIFHFPTNRSEIISFMKNLSIFGGLMLLSEQFAIA